MRRGALVIATLLLGCGGGSDASTPSKAVVASAPLQEEQEESVPTPVPRLDETGGGTAMGTVALPDPASIRPNPRGLENGDYAPDLVLTDLLTETTYTLSNHLGPTATEPTRAAIVGFVASWCGPCRASLPTLAELKREHGADLQVVLLATDNDRRGRLKEAEHVRKAGLDAVVLDPTPEVLRAYKGGRTNVPHFFILNKVGEVLVQDRGFGPKVKPILPKQVRYALRNPEYVERKKRKTRTTSKPKGS